MTTIFHNPRCSKSRQTLAILEDKGITPDIFLYLEEKLNKPLLKDILGKLDLSARDVLRKGEDAYKSLSLDDESLSEDALIEAIIQHPKLLERPIVIQGDRAVLGRPPENVLDIL